MLSVVDAAVRVLIFLIGLLIVIRALMSAIRVLVLPRNANDSIARLMFRVTRQIFNIRTRKATTYEERDRIMALYAPVSLLCLPCVWLIIVLVGYQLMFWALGVRGWQSAFKVSGSSLLTLGFATVEDLMMVGLSFTEAAIGLILVALLIAYLPT